MIPFIQTHTGALQLSKENGVVFTHQPPALSSFVDSYRLERTKSHRKYSDAQLKELPNAFAYNVHLKEWDMRSNSLKRFQKYLRRKKDSLYILEVGCGNGWFTEKLARNQLHQVFGLDVFMDELEQAARVFNLPNLHFCYGDIFEGKFPSQTFDMIVLNDSISYFPDLYKLLYTCMDLLKLGGEIHMMDSPIYKTTELEAAKESSDAIFDELGIPLMKDFYYHHSKDDLLAFPHQYLYKPGGVKSLFGHTGGCWPWVRIVKDEFA